YNKTIFKPDEIEAYKKKIEDVDNTLSELQRRKEGLLAAQQAAANAPAPPTHGNAGLILPAVPSKDDFDYSEADQTLKEYEDDLAKAGKIYDETRTPLEKYTEAEQRLYDLRSQGLISDDTLSRGLTLEQKKLDDATKKATRSGEELGFAFSSAFEKA